MKKIKVVQIGVGHDHAYPTMQRMRELTDVFEVVGYVKLPNEDVMFENTKKHYDGLPELTLEQALSIKGLKAAVIETEDNELTHYARIAIENGLCVQMDKPGGQDSLEYNDMVDLAKKKNLVFHTGYMYRYNPAIKKAIEIIKSGQLGDIYYVDAQMCCRHPDDKRQWLKKFQGGMMNYLGGHLIDLILTIQGKPDEIVPFNTATRDDLEGQDLGFAVLKYKNGVSFAKTTSMEVGGFKRRQIVICGEKGTIEINPIEYIVGEDYINQYADMRVALLENNNWHYRADKQVYGPYHRFDEMLKEFAMIVNGKIKNSYSYEYEKLLHDTILKACGI